jgi:hypothetical protein
VATLDLEGQGLVTPRIAGVFLICLRIMEVSTMGCQFKLASSLSILNYVVSKSSPPEEEVYFILLMA